MKILVTGSTGFVGERVCSLATKREWNVRSVVRRHALADDNTVMLSSIDADTDWSGALKNIDCVVHCAARVHQMEETKFDVLAAYREVNTLGTLNLARQASKAGVKRFVFISSIKVNGEYTEQGEPFQPHASSPPIDPYGLSKYEAEVGLKELAAETDLEVVIIRPPLVYGPGVKANFLSLLRWTKKKIPLPFGAIYNQRSLVYVDNLADLILECCLNPNAQGKVFLVSDDHDVSTTELLSCVAKQMGKPNRLIPIPASWLKGASTLIGKPAIGQRICSNLQVDISDTKCTLNWQPPVSFEQGIRNTVKAYLDSE
ncbi:UDP-glucose 4-epimerase family protein [Vibrio pacinii]|uniref:UDP-glucose 4-epimerase family protein n=1 Tax=Vibrio pacinii TaxID=170674 RepID=UPI00056DAFAD|nr:SDR family oxidoreductase [Vibrio pacinii]